MFGLHKIIRHRLFLLSAALFVGLLGAGAIHSPVASQSLPAAGARTGPSAPSRLEWQGVASCASTACHGGNGPRGSKGSEYTTWVLYDKHNKAYQALLDDRSRLIEKNLRQLPSIKDAHAEIDQLCLRCHAMNAENGPQRDSFVRDFGVGCESCHGPAQQWLGLHYARDWKTKSAEEKLALGFRPLTSLEERAKLCASCHVGNRDKEVNHDLLAAGHPRLNFELGAFQALMPKHWREEGENSRPDFEARAWVIGQLASAQAALELLEQRARSQSQPWPEFAEYDCFACHHGLQEPSWRQSSAHYANRAPGAFPWGTWYYPMLGQALRSSTRDADARLQKILAQLQKEMQQPSPNRKRVAEQAHEAGAELSRLTENVKNVHFSRAAIEKFLRSIRQNDQKVSAANWDSAAQVYLALAAFYNALADTNGGHGDPGLKEALKERAKQLEFPKGYDSPPGFEPIKDHRLLDQSLR
jgi:hypothetical protein